MIVLQIRKPTNDPLKLKFPTDWIVSTTSVAEAMSALELVSTNGGPKIVVIMLEPAA